MQKRKTNTLKQWKEKSCKNGWMSLQQGSTYKNTTDKNHPYNKKKGGNEEKKNNMEKKRGELNLICL